MITLLRRPATLLLPVLLWSLAGCGTSADLGFAGDRSPSPDAKFQKDREAILAMVGEYRVKFQFQETVAIEPGYELKEPYFSGASEFVEVAEDRGDTIVLQHILVMHPQNDDGSLNQDVEPVVIKHWRQDWVYEDTEMLEYRSANTWERVELNPKQVAGTWSQAVYQVDDSPRYESYGRWSHTGDHSTWLSEETWRPLPRREHSKRDDYQVLLARNRHTITPAGWVHEQENQKLVLDDAGRPDRVIAHESGLNVYDRTDEVDFTAGRRYWEETAAYWQDVREMWAETFAQSDTLELAGSVGGMKLYERMFLLAQDVRTNGYDDTKRQTAGRTVRRYVVSP
ncbi:MAG: DUF6607 family protein [Planctomycetota bacterium]